MPFPPTPPWIACRVVSAIRECGDPEPERESRIAGPLVPDIEVVAGPRTYAAHRSAQSFGGCREDALQPSGERRHASGTSMPEA